ncbi:hypothetical protein PG999_002962 [Apiospora kogelbergensis]|uniref:Nephrocystin 3-like N-terminal domain-containing protein n=1 Tax=Apiospora kogelbergensis TaxID=1337665 RepID=A0AAW0R9L4_9PEZI
MDKVLERLGRLSDHDGTRSSMVSPRNEQSPLDKSEVQPEAEGPDPGDLFGLFQLWPLKEDAHDVGQTKLDIIAVHGLNGKAFKTWTEKDKMWLADFLPVDIPYARIFTYGYNSGVAFTGSASRIDDYSRTLLERLMAKRRQFSPLEKRPLIFVCHSLGGVVVKRALVMAHERSQRYESITKDTVGIMFLGTPHRGSDGAFWAKLFGNLANTLTLGAIRTQLLEDLKRKSDILGAVCSQFVERSQSLHRIFSIYERVRIKGLPSLVVEEDSAVMGLPNEVPIPIEANHRSMCRFSTNSSEQYRMISDCIKEMAEDALGSSPSGASPLHDDFLHCIERLNADGILRSTTRASPGTCSWIIETSEFLRWRDDPAARILWISGPPGVGKSTALRFLTESLRLWLQKNQVSSGREHQVAFFFCSVTSGQLSSEEQLLDSLLHQILSSSKHLFRYLNDTELESYISKFKEFPASEEHRPENVKTLWRLLTTVLQRAAKMVFWILVDGLDELPDEVRDSFLDHVRLLIAQDLGLKLKFMICDRNSPAGRGVRHAVSWLNIHQRNNVSDDVRQYISSQVGDLCSSGVIPWQYQNTVEQSLVDISEGNFLQASLAWAHFHSGVSYWSPQVIRSRLEGLRRISSEAIVFFCSLLQRIPDDLKEVAKLGFIWVLGSRKPLNLIELQHAVAISAGQNSWADLQDCVGFNFNTQFDQAFGYLLRIGPDMTVRFAHTTVKELLTMPDNDLPAQDSRVLSEFIIRESDVDAELAKRCIIVLSFRDFVKLRDIAREAMADRMKDFFASSLQSEEALRSLSFAKYEEPDSVHSDDNETSTRISQAISRLGQTELDERTRSLFSYCVSYWNYHSNHASSDPEVSKSLTDFALLRQSHYFLMVAMLLGMAKYHQGLLWQDVDQFSRLPPLHFIMRVGDHPSVLRALFERGEDINELDCHGWSPLVWALLEGRKDSIQLLLSMENTKMTMNGKSGDHVLHISLRAELDNNMILRLLADPRTQVNALSREGWTALQWCLSREALLPIAQELLRRKDVDIYETNKQGLNAIEQIFDESISEKCALLICLRPDVPRNWYEKPRKLTSHSQSWSTYVATDEDTPRTYLYRAASLRWNQVEDLILENDPTKAMAPDRDGLGLLERYAYHGLEQRLRRVLPKLPPNIIISSSPDGGRRLLMLCVQQNWEHVTSILIHTFSVDDTGPDMDGKTIAHWASEMQWSSFPSLLLAKPRGWVDLTSRDGRTALHVAAEYRNVIACVSLLEAGANCTISDRKGQMAIHVAAEQGHRSIVTLLLQASALEMNDTWIADGQKRSILHYLVMWQSDSFIRQCLHILRPWVDRRDAAGKSPLHYASLFGNEPAVSVLLDIRADPNQKDSCQFTPLHHALKAGAVECAKTLVHHGRRQKSMPIEDYYDAYDGAEEISENLEEEEDVDEGSEYPTATSIERLIRIFTQLGADVNRRDKQGNTPLHEAAKRGNLSATRALLRVPGIEVSACNESKLTPLDFARVDLNERVVKALEAHGADHSESWWVVLKPLYTPWRSGYGFDKDKPAAPDEAMALGPVGG